MRTVLISVLAFITLGVGGRVIDGTYYLWCCNPIPRLACETGVTCDLQLPAGDRLAPQHPVIGDQTEWSIYAQGGSAPHVFFEPLRQTVNGSQQCANRTLVTIPRENAPMHPYHVWLYCVAHVQHPVYAFYTPLSTPVARTAMAAPTPEPPLVLRGTYRISGNAPFAPARIGNDGLRTYIFFSRLASFPVPIVIDELGHELPTIPFAPHVLDDGGREYIIPGLPHAIKLSLGGGKHKVFLTVTCVSGCS